MAIPWGLWQAHGIQYPEGVQYNGQISTMVNPLHLVKSGEPPRVGQSLQGRRQALGMSLEDLARKSGVSKSMLSQIERNQTNPTVALVWRLANALGVAMTDLLDVRQQDAPALAVL